MGIELIVKVHALIQHICNILLVFFSSCILNLFACCVGIVDAKCDYDARQNPFVESKHYLTKTFGKSKWNFMKCLIN